MNFFKENLFGLLIGAVYGILTPFIYALGLMSQTMEKIGFIFALPGILLKYLQIDLGLYALIIVLINLIFYAVVGGLLQKWLKKKRYVAFIFAGIIVLVILIMVIETIIRKSLGLHVGA